MAFGDPNNPYTRPFGQPPANNAFSAPAPGFGANTAPVPSGTSGYGRPGTSNTASAFNPQNPFTQGPMGQTARAGNNTGPSGFASPATAAPSTEGVLSGPGYYEDFYKTHGQDLMGTPTASERLFDQGIGALNPYYDFAEEAAHKSINDAAAARGNFNSSFTLKNLANASANLRGQQAREMGERASAADQGRFGRYGLSSEMADRAQGRTEGRIGQATNAYTGLARDQAGLVRDFYGDAGRGMDQANMAAIEAQLKASGMDAAEIQGIMNFLLSAGGLGVRAGA